MVGSSGLVKGPVGDWCEQCHEVSDHVNWVKCSDHVSDC